MDIGRDADPGGDAPTISIEFQRPRGARREPSPGAHRRPVMTVRRSILALLFSTCTCTLFAQQPEPPTARRITLREAVDLALARNHVVRLARLSVEEKDHAKDVAKSAYFPQIRNETGLVHVTDTQLIAIPSGGLGSIGAIQVPPQTLIL